MAADSVRVGSTWGRWTVLRHAAPAPRYGAGFARARVHVRCVCGHETDVWVCDLQASNGTRGCRSVVCRARFEAAQQLRMRFEALLSDFLTGGRDGG